MMLMDNEVELEVPILYERGQVMLNDELSLTVLILSI
jgi:hypothetical protein